MTPEPEDRAVKVCPRRNGADHLFCRACAEIAAEIRAAVEEEREGWADVLLILKSIIGHGIDYPDLEEVAHKAIAHAERRGKA